MRLIRGLGALALLVALLVGVPLALVHFVGRPWPAQMPPLETIWSSVKAGDISDTVVIKALAILVWLSWARLAVSVAVEIAARLAGAHTPRVVGLGSAQQWAAGLIAAIVLLVGASPRIVAARAPVGPPPIAASLLQVDTMRAPASLHDLYAGRAARAPVRTGSQDALVTTMPTMATHVVQRHESFWSIADDELGDGSRWREIVDLNRGVEVGPGTVFDGTPNRLLPGWVLLLPAGAGGVISAPAAPAESAPTVAADALAPDSLAPEALVREARLPESAATPVVETVRVEAGDTLSGIAADRLGDPTAWPQLWEANQGRHFGGRTFDDPNLILAGWELVVPATFAPTPEAPPPAPVEAPIVEAPVVEASVVEASVVEASVVEASVVEAPVVEAPSADVPVVEEPVVVSLPVEAPAVTGTPDTAAPAATPPAVPGPNIPTPLVTGTADRSTPTLVTADGSDDGVGEDASASSVTVAGLGAAVLLSGGVMTAVVSRRRRRLRGAAMFARLAAPSPAATATEAVLRSLGEGERVARVDIALRAAAAELTVCAPGVAVLGAITTADGRIDLLLTGAVPDAPQPWSSVTGHRWRLSADTTLADLAVAARRANQPCPALAHIGTVVVDDRSDPGDLFLDLEAMGLLTIESRSGERGDGGGVGGDDETAGSATDVLRAIATGLAVSPLAEIAHLVACGLPDVLLGHPSSEPAESLDIALDLAASAIGATAATTSADLRTFTLRARHQGGEAWEPAIVFASGTAADAKRGGASDADLVALTATPGRGLAVVVDRPVVGATWRLVQGADRWTLLPLDLVVVPIGITTHDLDCVRLLLDEADREPELAVDVDVDDVVGAADGHSVGSGPIRWVEPEWSLMVHLLGPVSVTDRDGRSVEFERSKALELVVWLSQHRDRSTRTGARTALWDLDVRDATFANVVSDARRAMARSVPPAEAEEWIGRTLTEQLPLHPGVVADADLLAARLACARRQTGHDAIETLRPGLELVCDAPFSGTSYLWPDTEGITSQLTLLVTSAAASLAAHYLAQGDTDGVFWATGQGLKVLAGHEELIALRMRAHARSGDLSSVRLEWESYERALNADPWSDGEPAPKLVALRRQLLSGALLAGPDAISRAR